MNCPSPTDQPTVDNDGRTRLARETATSTTTQRGNNNSSKPAAAPADPRQTHTAPVMSKQPIRDFVRSAPLTSAGSAQTQLSDAQRHHADAAAADAVVNALRHDVAALRRLYHQSRYGTAVPRPCANVGKTQSASTPTPVATSAGRPSHSKPTAVTTTHSISMEQRQQIAMQMLSYARMQRQSQVPGHRRHPQDAHGRPHTASDEAKESANRYTANGDEDAIDYLDDGESLTSSWDSTTASRNHDDDDDDSSLDSYGSLGDSVASGHCMDTATPHGTALPSHAAVSQQFWPRPGPPSTVTVTSTAQSAAASRRPATTHSDKAQLALMTTFNQARQHFKHPLIKKPSAGAKPPPQARLSTSSVPSALPRQPHTRRAKQAAVPTALGKRLKNNWSYDARAAHAPRADTPTASPYGIERFSSTHQQSMRFNTKATRGVKPAAFQHSPLLLIGSDIVITVVAFLEPTETLKLLTAPLCKQWRQQTTCHQDIWRTLCSSKPFNAIIAKAPVPAVDAYASESDPDDDDDDDSFCSLSDGHDKDGERHEDDPLGRYRMMYTSFIRCMRYLQRIQDNAKNGRSHNAIETGVGGTFFPHFGPSKNLKKFLARARSVMQEQQALEQQRRQQSNAPSAQSIHNRPIGVSDDMTSDESSMSSTPASASATAGAAHSRQHDGDAAHGDQQPGPVTKRPRFGNSMITSRLLGPPSKGKPGMKNLPISCAIFSIVNWMVGFADVAGIQTMCISTLPILLEDEQQRLTAQRYGVAEVILRAMQKFPDSAELHTAVFHTMVLLARPLGGREGMLFDNTMDGSSTHPLMTPLRGTASTVRNNSGLPRGATALDGPGSRGISLRTANAGSDASSAKKPSFGSMERISIMLRSMSKFRSNAKLQAMACWAMVNLALSPVLKSQIILGGGIQATITAMQEHPVNPDVQFRALFALINLVICSTRNVPAASIGQNGIAVRSPDLSKERAVLEENVGTITRLVVTAMKNFCASETILNRACLVLHNISQNPNFVHRLLWTPNCYQMLEWCIANYPTESVLRRSAATTLQRLQMLLSRNEGLRNRFIESLRVRHDLTSAR